MESWAWKWHGKLICFFLQHSFPHGYNQKEWTKMTRTYNFLQIGYGNLNLFHMHGQVASLAGSNHFFLFCFLSELGPSLTFPISPSQWKENWVELGWVATIWDPSWVKTHQTKLRSIQEVGKRNFLFPCWVRSTFPRKWRKKDVVHRYVEE